MRAAAILIIVVLVLAGCSLGSRPLLLEGAASSGGKSVRGTGKIQYDVSLTLTSSDGLVCKAVVDQRDKEYRPGKVICSDGSHGLMALLWKDRAGDGIVSLKGVNYRFTVKELPWGSPVGEAVMKEQQHPYQFCKFPPTSDVGTDKLLMEIQEECSMLTSQPASF